MKTGFRFFHLVLLFLPLTLFNCDPFESLPETSFKASPPAGPQLSSKLTITGGTLNGSAIDTSSLSFTVPADSYLNGSLTVKATNGFTSNDPVQLGATNTWHTHDSAYWLEEILVPSGEKSYDVGIHETAPTTPGTYYLILAMGEALDVMEIFSCTDETVLTNGAWNPRWDDGNDVAGFSTDQIADSRALGAAEVDYLYDDGLHKEWLPAVAFRIVVQ